MILNEENYFSEAANMEYMSVSQYKSFCGSYGKMWCEARAMAELRGEWNPPPSTAMMVGSYVDRYFEGTLDRFKEEHPEIFRRDGELKAEYKGAEKIIQRVERDDVFMKYMSGQKQVIMTGEIEGIPWKIKIDSYLEGKAIVDLKVMESITKLKWVKDIGYLDFVRYWGYDTQGAVYQEIVRQNTGKRLPFYIAGVTKEATPNMEVIFVNNVYLDEALNKVRSSAKRIADLKAGKVQPERCECCDYCRETKVLKGPIGIQDLVAEF